MRRHYDLEIGVDSLVPIARLNDPRIEAEEHYDRAAHTKLLDLGLVPHLLDDELIASLAAVVERHADRIITEAIA
ncbi:MAG: hypothetical protein ACRDY2_05410, partial [Acidimicrobiales bacterium]